MHVQDHAYNWGHLQNLHCRLFFQHESYSHPSATALGAYCSNSHEITGGNPVPSSPIGKQECLVDSYPSQTISALSLTLGVDQKTQAKIHSHEYVKFASLLKPNDPDNEESYNTVEKDGQLMYS